MKGECVLYTWILYLQDTLEGLDKKIEERIASEDQKIEERIASEGQKIEDTEDAEDQGDLGDLELAEALQVFTFQSSLDKIQSPWPFCQSIFVPLISSSSLPGFPRKVRTVKPKPPSLGYPT